MFTCDLQVAKRKDFKVFLDKSNFLLNNINISKLQPSDFWVGRQKIEISLKKLWYKIADYINKADFERIKCKIT